MVSERQACDMLLVCVVFIWFVPRPRHFPSSSSLMGVSETGNNIEQFSFSFRLSDGSDG